MLTHQFLSPFETYGLLGRTSQAYSGAGNGELRARRGSNVHVVVFIPTDREVRLVEGVNRTSEYIGNFRSAGKAEIFGYFSQPEYAIPRPTEFLDDMRYMGYRMIRDTDVMDLKRLVFQCVSCKKHQHIEELPIEELMGHGGGVDMENPPLR